MIVILEKVHSTATIYIAPWEGDPGRTCIKENAKKFKTYNSALKALKKAQKYKAFPNAEIIEE